MNYPLGAKYDPRAPYNKEEIMVTKRVLVSITLSKTIELEVPDDGDERDLINAYKESLEYQDIQGLLNDNWSEDEFEIMEDFSYAL